MVANAVRFFESVLYRGVPLAISRTDENIPLEKETLLNLKRTRILLGMLFGQTVLFAFKLQIMQLEYLLKSILRVMFMCIVYFWHLFPATVAE